MDKEAEPEVCFLVDDIQYMTATTTIMATTTIRRYSKAV
jgi:hypothetical protein